MFELILAIIGWTLFGLAVFVGLMLDMVGLFGNWIILVAVGIAAAMTGFEHFGGWTIVILLVLAVLGEALETFASGVGTAKFGGGRGAIFASIVGCIAGAVVGTPIFPIVGTIVGACLGAFLGAALYEFLMNERGVHEAAWIGVGAAAGKVGGLFAKTFIGFAMLLVAALNY